MALIISMGALKPFHSMIISSMISRPFRFCRIRGKICTESTDSSKHSTINSSNCSRTTLFLLMPTHYHPKHYNIKIHSTSSNNRCCNQPPQPIKSFIRLHITKVPKTYSSISRRPRGVVVMAASNIKE